MFKQLPPKVLVSTPDNTFSTSICNIVERYWFNTIKSNSYEETIKLVKKHFPHVIIISDTFSVEKIKKTIEVVNSISTNIIPFVILKSKTLDDLPDSEFIITVNHPFTPYEIINSIRSLLRRSKPVFQTSTLTYKDILMNLSTYKIFRGKREIHLGPTEFEIMKLFLSEPRTVFSREVIIEHIWGKNHQIDIRTIDVHVNRIRSLLKDVGDKEHIIKTVRSFGYCLENSSSE